MTRKGSVEMPLLETKLYVPRWRDGLVSRPRLIEQLDHGLVRKVTLISASAGFGKTTLLAEWLANVERAVGWVSLDQGDNDPAIFWAYFVAALQKIQSGVGDHALSLLRLPQPPPVESVLTTLINEISAIEDDFVLVLDDYHILDTEAIHTAVTFLIDHLPPQMHMVIASRSDPVLPLARLRGRGELVELRAADLRFVRDEAAAFLNEMIGLNLDAGDVAALEGRTEGWVAGLQLAALSMQGREDVEGFIKAFAGDDRYIVDYLVEEVLESQPDAVRQFLLQTSILKRLNGGLCNAVTGDENSKSMLEALERDNLFVVPLDDKRQWYRYHHLFGDVVLAHLTAEHPDRLPVLHGRASEWYEQEGLRSDAIHHAFAAEDFERAAGLVELSARTLLRNYQPLTALERLKALPDEQIRARPVLCAYYSVVLFGRGELEAAEVRLRDVERWLDDMGEPGDAQPPGMVVTDEEEFRSLPGIVAIGHAFHVGALGDVSGVVTYTQRALDLLPEDDYLWRAAAAILLGLAYWTQGDLESAHQIHASGIASLQMIGDMVLAIGASYDLADIRIAQGHLQEAKRIYENALQLASDRGEPLLRGAAEIHLGLSELLREQGDLEAANQHLQRSEELAEKAALPDWKRRWCLVMARIKKNEGDWDQALDLLDEAERLYTFDPTPILRPVPALKARVRILQGKLNEVQSWARDQSLSVDDDLSYAREFDHITLARLLIAQYKSEQKDQAFEAVMTLLGRLLQAAKEGGRTGSMIEVLILQALVHDEQGDIPAALLPLEQALTLAEPEGYVRIFVEEGEAVRDLLRHAVAGGIASSYARKLLSVFDALAQPVAVPTATTELVEQLTNREVEIVRLIAAGMRNQEIADHLFISLSTVKRHIANAYGKLGVSHRTEAIARANELDLL